jgi:hypothetical protein
MFDSGHTVGAQVLLAPHGPPPQRLLPGTQSRPLMHRGRGNLWTRPTPVLLMSRARLEKKKSKHNQCPPGMRVQHSATDRVCAGLSHLRRAVPRFAAVRPTTRQAR